VKKKLAFVLSGGGARGALQVGALRALLEVGYLPEVLVGTSIGAANAALLALRGLNEDGLQALDQAWLEAAALELLPSNYLWLTVRSLFNRPISEPAHRLKEFCISQGISAELKFGDLKGVSLRLVTVDLNSGQRIIYGNNPNDSVLDGLLASTALPPWVTPYAKDGKLLVDGGVVSNLPIEAALVEEVSEIIALDISDWRDVPPDGQGFGPFLGKLIATIQNRQVELELALAVSCNVPVHYIHLVGEKHVPLWNFSQWQELMANGYKQTNLEIAKWKSNHIPWWRRVFGSPG
jgi:NTE family protein